MADVLHRFSWFQYVRHGIRPLANRAVLSGLISRKLSKQSAGSLSFYTLMVAGWWWLEEWGAHTTRSSLYLLKNTHQQHRPSFYTVYCVQSKLFLSSGPVEIFLFLIFLRLRLFPGIVSFSNCPKPPFDIPNSISIPGKCWNEKLSLWQWFDLWFLAAPN